MDRSRILHTGAVVLLMVVIFIAGMATADLVRPGVIDNARAEARGEVLAWQLERAESGCPVLVPPGVHRFPRRWIVMRTNLRVDTEKPVTIQDGRFNGNLLGDRPALEVRGGQGDER